MATSEKRPNYGIDAPQLVRGFLIGGIVAAAIAITSALTVAAWSPWSWLVTGLSSIAAAYLLGMGTLMIVWSRITKIQERETLLDRIEWRGDEDVLDVGCGRGLMLVGAAKRLTQGRAVGIDIWQAVDQSGNIPEGALENAVIEGVADRVEVRTADMRSLPFENASFDVIVSHWAVHNLAAKVDREAALSEMVRVLRPGGTIVLSDIENQAAYRASLAGHGLNDQHMVAPPIRNAILRSISFGSFEPATLFARS